VNGEAQLLFSQGSACVPLLLSSGDEATLFLGPGGDETIYDIAPCGGNGMVDVDDLIALLDAFEGMYACTCPGVGAGWALMGNAGTNPATDFLGTTDNVPLNFRVNNQLAFRLEPTASVPNVVGGSVGNMVTKGATGATIAGGGEPGMNNNRVTDRAGTVAGGYDNQAGDGAGTAADNTAATVGGGFGNTASSTRSTVGGGIGNMASGIESVIAGGGFNTTSGLRSAVCGGRNNSGSGDYSSIGGGGHNSGSGDYSSVGGGDDNSGYGNYSAVSGGRFNSGNDYSSVGGGRGNSASGYGSTVGGGYDNASSGEASTVGGGSSNSASGAFSTIAGGGEVPPLEVCPPCPLRGNEATGDRTAIGGGTKNVASGYAATIPGGEENQAGGDYSLAGGRRARIRDATQSGDSDGDEGTFMWADSTDADITSTGPNQFLIRAMGGVGIGTNAPQSQLSVYDGDDNADVTMFTQNLTDAGVNIVTDYANGNYTPGVFWSTANNNATKPKAGIYLHESGAGTAMHFGTSNSFATGITNDALTISPTGNVGVGTNAPEARVHVNGDSVWISGTDSGSLSTTAGAGIRMHNSGGVSHIFAYDYANTQPYNLILQGAGGGNVGIGTNAPAQKLHVNGSVQATCGVLTCSDARFKKDVTPVAGALETVAKLHGVEFGWKRDEFPDRNFSGDRQIGFIAQDVAEVMPEVVFTGSDGYMSVDYGRLTPLLVEAMRDLRTEKDRQIEERDCRIEEVEARLDAKSRSVQELESRITKLERTLQALTQAQK